jgi:hypothetical protein
VIGLKAEVLADTLREVLADGAGDERTVVAVALERLVGRLDPFLAELARRARVVLREAKVVGLGELGEDAREEDAARR